MTYDGRVGGVKATAVVSESAVRGTGKRRISIYCRVAAARIALDREERRAARRRGRVGVTRARHEMERKEPCSCRAVKTRRDKTRRRTRARAKMLRVPKRHTYFDLGPAKVANILRVALLPRFWSEAQEGAGHF